VSQAAERRAREYVAAIQQVAGVTKSAGSTSLLLTAVTPLMEAMVDAEGRVAKLGKKIRKQHKVLKAIAATTGAVAGPSRMVGYRPDQWKIGLSPASTPKRNGHTYPRLRDDHGQYQAPGGHPESGQGEG
jgi:hypothetical protein